MRNRHITRFGSPLNHSGALFFVKDQDGLIQMDVDLEIEQLRVKGRFITSDIVCQVQNDVKLRRVEYHEKVNQIGVPDVFRELFLITKKAEVEQYARNIKVSEYDLFLLIHNCSQIRFIHRSKFKQYIPKHLKVSVYDREQMKEGNPKQFFKKTDSILLERKYIHVHLFESGSDWHCFYFTHQDIEQTDNHWKYGSHMHYISHLWPNLRKGLIWNKFNQRSTEISDSLHIKFEPFMFPHPDEPIKKYLNNESGLSPWAVIFNPDLAYGCSSLPLPVPHMTTRGLWIARTSLSKSMK